MTDERPDSLAAQAASWVPPWERAQRPPDPAYAAAQAGEADDLDDPADDLDAAAPVDRDDESGLAEDDDDFDPAFEGPDLAAGGTAEGDSATGGTAGGGSAAGGSGESGTEVPPELPPFPGEAGGPATVDAPQELPGEEELDPTDVGVGPELPLPGAIEEAADNETGQSPLVDAPLPPDGDDAGDVFDQAADDDVSDDAEVDLPVTEEVPLTDDEPDEPAAESVDSEGAATDSAAGAAEAGSDQPADGPSGANNGVPTQKRRKKVVVEAPPEEDVELKPLDEQELRAALESILLVVDEPVAEMQLAQIMEQPTERIAIALEDLSARYTAAGSGIDLRRAAGGWRFYTRPEFAPYVERFVLDGQSVRLTQAALETLAVVAYKQPVTRSRISAIRGVNCDGVMRTLVTRGLIEECGTEGETGAFLYRTTALFLEKLGLNSVDQLPPLAPFLPDDVEEVLDASG